MRCFGKNTLNYIKGLADGHIDYLPRLPQHLLVHILRFLDLQDLSRVACLSKMFRKVRYTLSHPPLPKRCKINCSLSVGALCTRTFTYLTFQSMSLMQRNLLIVTGTSVIWFRVLYDVSVCCSCATVTHCGRSCTRTTSALTMSGTNCAHWPKRSAGRNSSSPTNYNYK